MTNTRYNPFAIEPKWQKTWNDSQAFKVTEDISKPKYYVLEMFPYPSGKLHMGHVRNYSIGDAIARFKKAQGFNVMHPMGWDSFGLPAENAAMQNNVNPAEWTESNIKAMRTGFDQLGLSFDWSREVATCRPDYYGKQQEFFIDMYNKGMVYRKEALVNWDPVDCTVLANEQVVDGKGWRSGALVERRSMTQWFMKITDYAEELLSDLDKLENWPERVKTMQSNWIGKSEGLTFKFAVKNSQGEDYTDGLEVYTTRPDTIMGVTFCSVAPESDLAKFVAESDSEAVSFIKECQALGTSQEAIEKAEKKGYKTGLVAIHPLTSEEVPIYIANFVLMGYGTGAVMAVPAHDERDFEFAKKYNLPIKQVVSGGTVNADNELEEAYTGSGILINSGDRLDGLNNQEAKNTVIDMLESMKVGNRKTNYRLRDWGISRQRYWGCPIPFVECGDCGIVAVDKANLPIELPKQVDFSESGNPLERDEAWKATSCPKCGGKASRITDTMDTFMDSSWYFARYCSPQADAPIDKSASDYWLGDKHGNQGIDQYIGGIEHAVMHLLYARFVTKALRDCGYLNLDEPFNALLTQGMVLHNSYQQESTNKYIYPNEIDWNGEEACYQGEKLKVNRMEKMSKSKNNVVEPSELISKYGADTARLFILFAAPVDKELEWSDTAVDGAWRFLGRLWGLAADVDWSDVPIEIVAMADIKDKQTQELKRDIHKTIRRVTTDVARFQFNTMIAAVMELSNKLGLFYREVIAKDGCSKNDASIYREGVEACVRLLNPIAPHITEELWSIVRPQSTETLCELAWLECDEESAKDDEITLVVQINGKLRERLTVPADISNQDAEEQALASIQSQLEGLTVRKCIVVPKRLVNIVAN